MESCGMNLIKYILFVFNLVFALSGIGIIIAGAVVIADVGEFSHFMESRILAPPIVLIVAGAIVFLVAFLGCFGAIKESYAMLMAFALCLLIIFIVEMAVGIAAAVFKSDFQMAMKDTLKQSLANYSTKEMDKLAWNNVQTKLKCCGVDGPSDWLGTTNPDRAMPHSCCYARREGAAPPTEQQCRSAAANDDYVYQEGCFYKLQMKAEAGAKILIGVGIGIAFIEVIGIIFACLLANAIKKGEGDEK